MPDGDVDLSGWPDLFTSSSIFVPTFGGPKTGWSHFGDAVGHVEGVPHGTVHVDVGGPGGLMSAFETAGQDAIFWLHHANIDRLWEVWRNQPGHADPPDDEWQNVAFEFGFGDAQTTLAVPQIVDTSTSPLQYEYEGVPVFVPPEAGGGFALDAGQQPPRGRGADARRRDRAGGADRARPRGGHDRGGAGGWAGPRRGGPEARRMSCFRT